LPFPLSRYDVSSKAQPAIVLPATLAIGFTGCRSLPDETASRSLLRELLRERVRLTKGVVYGISSLAEGGDLLFAEACSELGIALQLLVPMPADELPARFTASTSARVERALQQAISVEIVGSQSSPEEDYYECGIETVNRSGLLIALRDGGGSPDLSEAYSVAAYAEKTRKPVVWIRSDQGTIQPLSQAAENKLLHDPELNFLNHLPDSGVACPGESPTEIATRWFQKIDANASMVAPQVRRVASIPIVYTALAAVISGTASKSSAGIVWIAASALLGVTSAALPFFLRLDQRQTVWARTRTAAEVCRSALALWDAPFSSEVIGPEIGVEFAGVLTSLRFLKMQALAHSKITVEEFKRRYRNERIMDQINYYSRHAAQAEHETRNYRRVTFLSIAAAVLLALCWLAGRMGVSSLQFVSRGSWFGFTLSAFFQGATIVAALEIVNDSKRRQGRYRELHEWLTDWNRQLDALRTWPSVLKVVIQVEKALMVELLEWRSLAKNTKLPRK
jgi:hypothetical protein